MGVGENMRWQRIWRRWGSSNLGFLIIVNGGRPALPHLWLKKEVKRLAMPVRRWRLVSWLSPGQGIKSEGDPLCLPVLSGAYQLWQCEWYKSESWEPEGACPSPLFPHCEHSGYA